MSEKLITAEEARDMLENKVTPYPYTGDPFSGFKDANGELVVWEDDITGDTCTTPQFISGALIAPRLMETIIAQAGQIKRLQAALRTASDLDTLMERGYLTAEDMEDTDE